MVHSADYGRCVSRAVERLRLLVFFSARRSSLSAFLITYLSPCDWAQTEINRHFCCCVLVTGMLKRCSYHCSPEKKFALPRLHINCHDCLFVTTIMSTSICHGGPDVQYYNNRLICLKLIYRIFSSWILNKATSVTKYEDQVYKSA